MKKFTILAGLMALALSIGVAGTTFRADKAEARPSDVISFNPDVCAFIIGGIDLADAGDCYFTDLTGLADIADDLEGDVDSPDTYKDLVDASAAQLGADSIVAHGVPPATNPSSQSMWVVVFATNGDDVTLNADEGIWLSGTGAGTSTTTQTPNADDMVINLLYAGATAPLDLGSAIVTATQDGIDVEMDYEVVGSPDSLALAATKTTIQEDAAHEDCSLGDFTDVIGLPQVAGLLADVTDEDGTSLTGIWVDWDSSDSDVANLAFADPADASDDSVIDATVSIASSGQASAPNLACGGETGTSTFAAVVAVDDSIDAEVDITVVGAPASMTLAANPPSITCNGTNTSEVSATVLDADGKPVVAGNAVRFEVVALGTANPIIAKTDANGVAKTAITPLSGVTAGVTVLVMVVSDETIEQNILVACQPAVPTVVPPPVTPTTPVVTPPVTGDGGYLP